MHGQRGQALVESAFFLPIMLLALFGLLFFARLGVLSERAQLAARYGGTVVLAHGQPYAVTTLQDLIVAATTANANQFSVFCLSSGGSGGGSDVARAAGDALIQNEGNADSSAPSGSVAGPSAHSFWRPTAVSAANCTPGSASLSTGPASPVVPISVTGVSIAGTVDVPPYLNTILGAQSQGFGAQWNVINLALPSTLLACNVPLLNTLQLVVTPGAPLAVHPPGC